MKKYRIVEHGYSTYTIEERFWFLPFWIPIPFYWPLIFSCPVLAEMHIKERSQGSKVFKEFTNG